MIILLQPWWLASASKIKGSVNLVKASVGSLPALPSFPGRWHCTDLTDEHPDPFLVPESFNICYQVGQWHRAYQNVPYHKEYTPRNFRFFTLSTASLCMSCVLCSSKFNDIFFVLVCIHTRFNWPDPLLCGLISPVLTILLLAWTLLQLCVLASKVAPCCIKCMWLK